MARTHFSFDVLTNFKMDGTVILLNMNLEGLVEFAEKVRLLDHGTQEIMEDKHNGKIVRLSCGDVSSIELWINTLELSVADTYCEKLASSIQKMADSGLACHQYLDEIESDIGTVIVTIGEYPLREC